MRATTRRSHATDGISPVPDAPTASTTSTVCGQSAGDGSGSPSSGPCSVSLVPWCACSTATRSNCRRANLRARGANVSVGGGIRRPYRVRVGIDGASYFVGGWPSRRCAESVREEVARVAAGLRGRGLSRKQIQRALDLATGREVSRLPGRRPQALEVTSKLAA